MIFDNFTPLSLAVEVYLEWKSTYTHYAYQRYKTRLDDFVKFLGADKSISNITGNDIQQYTKQMKNKVTFYGKVYSDTTIAYTTTILKNFFEFWKGRGITQLNPKEIRSIRYVRTYREHVTQDDVDDLFLALDEHYYEDVLMKLVISLLWDTGMRISELVDLNLSDIQPCDPSGKGSAIIRTRKTMRYNLVVWGSETTRLLNRYLGARLCMFPNEEAVFILKKKKTRMNVRYVQRTLKELCKQAMIDKDITPHCFRHGKAHQMLDQGANHRDIMAVLRHSNPLSSFHYLSLNETHFRQVAEKYV